MLSRFCFMFLLFFAHASFASVVDVVVSPCCVEFGGVTKVRGLYAESHPDQDYIFRFGSGYYIENAHFDTSTSGEYYGVNGTISLVLDTFPAPDPLYMRDIDFLPYQLGSELSGTYRVTLSHSSEEDIFFGIARTDAVTLDFSTASPVLREETSEGYFDAGGGFNYYAVVYGDVSSDTEYSLQVASVPLPGSIVFFLSSVVPFYLLSLRKKFLA